MRDREAKTKPLDEARAAAEAVAPVVWLLGKAQAGKSSIVAEMTGQGHEEIGDGFARATLTSRIYAFPEDLPVVRFLDTRGLEDEADYDPFADLAGAEEHAHLLLAVVRAEDLNLDALLHKVRRLRKAHPQWPLLVAQTRLHDLYPRGTAHRMPYPGADALADFPGDLPETLAAQREAFAALPGAAPVFVPLDFTRPAAGYTPENYGAEALWEALKASLPVVHERLFRGKDPAENARHQVIIPWALAAAGADAIPAPFVGGLASSGFQARMVNAIAKRFGLRRDVDLWRRFVQLLGFAFGARYGAKFLLRQGVKMVPGLGTAAVALWSFAITYALGEAAVYFCREVAAGREPDREALRQTYAKNLEAARALWEARQAKAAAVPDTEAGI